MWVCADGLGTTRAAVPQQLNYQGREAVNGVNFDGNGQFKFALVKGNGSVAYCSNDGISSVGLQPTSPVTLPVTKGLNSALLGNTALANMTALPPPSAFRKCLRMSSMKTPDYTERERGGIAADWSYRRTPWLAISAIAMGWIATAMHGFAANVSLNGGSSWIGWTSRGQSNQLGVYGSGTTTDVYEVYSTIFSFDNHSVDKTGGAVGGGPTGGSTGFGTGAFSTGAFANGNRILGIGVRRISGAALSTSVQTIRFDLDGDSYRAATTVGGTDGRASFSQNSEYRDFTVQFGAGTSWAGTSINVQANDPGPFNNGLLGGTNNQQTISFNGVSSDWPFRAFGLTDSYQSFFDLDAMHALYGSSNPFGKNSNFVGIGALNNPDLEISMNGLGGNNIAFGAPTAVPEPASTLAVLALFSGGVLNRRKRVVRGGK